MAQHTPSTEDTSTEGLEVYQVGGSVRDELMGLAVTDRDYVVVGASHELMKQRGFRSVGQDFPVFLHPISHEEYALARTERKKGHGYHGFEFDTGPNVTLEEDLGRRDLTINAMAVDADGQLIDPYNGRLDLAKGVLRHVSEAFREDPVRVLRLARFATRFSSFSIADATIKLCHEMQACGELDYLVPERVWQEMAKALMHAQPSRFISVLVEVHALRSIWPELDGKVDTADFAHALRALDQLAQNQHAPIEARFAMICSCLNADEVGASIERLKPPKVCGYWAKWCVAALSHVPGVARGSAESILSFIQSFDGIRQPERLAMVSMLSHAWCQAKTTESKDPESDLAVVACALKAMAAIDAEALVAQGLAGPAMAKAIEAARLECIIQCQGQVV